jgi:hypothetical protein
MQVRETGAFFGEESLFKEAHPLHRPWVKFEAMTRVEILYLEPSHLIDCLHEVAKDDEASSFLDKLASSVFTVAINHRVETLWRMRIYVCVTAELTPTSAAVAVQRAYRGHILERCLADVAGQSLDEILPSLYGIKPPPVITNSHLNQTAATARASRGSRQGSQLTPRAAQIADRASHLRRRSSLSASAPLGGGQTVEQSVQSSVALRRQSVSLKTPALDESAVQKRLEALEQQSAQQAQQLDRVLGALARIESVLSASSNRQKTKGR